MMRVARWQGALVAVLVASAMGLYVGNHAFFLLAIVPLVYVAYGRLTGLGPPAISVERRFDATRASPGQSVTVSLTVENEGDRPIPDLRIVDDVPDDVRVLGDEPAACVALRPGEATTLEYDVLLPRGTHVFGDATVRGRNLAGTVVGTTDRAVAGERRLTCDTVLDEVPLHAETTHFPGREPTDAGGGGVEFRTVREYRRGDSLSSIDWRRLARTGELATVTFRAERAAAVVFVVDARPGSALVPPSGGPSAVDLSVYGAARGLVALTDAGHRVGVTSLAPGAWVSPGRDAATEAEATDLLDSLGADAPADADVTGDRSPLATDGGGTGTGTGDTSDGPGDDADDDTADGSGDLDATAVALRLSERLPPNAQVILCSPLADALPVAVVEELLARGRPVSVLSPDVTGVADGTATPGRAVSALARRSRLATCSKLGVPVADWAPRDPIGTAMADLLAAHGRGWNR